ARSSIGASVSTRRCPGSVCAFRFIRSSRCWYSRVMNACLFNLLKVTTMRRGQATLPDLFLSEICNNRTSHEGRRGQDTLPDLSLSEICNNRTSHEGRRGQATLPDLSLSEICNNRTSHEGRRGQDFLTCSYPRSVITQKSGRAAGARLPDPFLSEICNNRTSQEGRLAPALIQWSLNFQWKGLRQWTSLITENPPKSVK